MAALQPSELDSSCRDCKSCTRCNTARRTRRLPNTARGAEEAWVGGCALVGAGEVGGVRIRPPRARNGDCRARGTVLASLTRQWRKSRSARAQAPRRAKTTAHSGLLLVDGTRAQDALRTWKGEAAANGMRLCQAYYIVWGED
eukprot:771085-Prymnesium_polylepis.3